MTGEPEPDPARRPPDLLFPVPQDAFPFAHRFADLPSGARLHYVDEGPAHATHTILFLHGNPTWSFLYRRIIADLRSTYRCVAVDYPGFGLSVAPPGYTYRPAEHSAAIEAFCLWLALGPMTLMVHDWGGPIGLGLAGRRPQWIDRLIIGNTWAWPVKGDITKERFSGLMGGPIGRFFGINFNAIVHLFLRAGTRRTLSARELEMYVRPFRSRSRRYPTVIFPREITAASAYMREVEAGLWRIADRPVLIVWGTADPVYHLKDLERFERLFPNHTTVRLEGARHYIQEDAPESIGMAIRQFLSASAQRA